MLKIGMLLVLAAGCAHHQETTRGSARAEDEFSRAYESVATGAQNKARGGGFVIEKAGDEGVRVLREAPSGGLGRDVSDASITAEVKGKVTQQMQVQTQAGTVTLQGNVASRDQALKAVRDTLDTDGVTAVDSQLQFPGNMRAGTVPPTKTF